MAQNEAYREAERKIEEARRTGAKNLDLSGGYDDETPKLAELPESLCQLTQLQKLYLSRNQLTALPEWLGELTQLETLQCYDNRLAILPESLGKLTRLTHLAIFGNRLRDLPGSLNTLGCLTELWLGNNSPNGGNLLTTVPLCIQNFILLGTLALTGNDLERLPDWLSELKQLRYLYVSDTKLIDIPRSLASLGHLEELHLENNPLNPELAAAYKEGLASVKRYLRAKAGAQVVLNEAKLILIGEGAVGKSALLGALRGDDWVEKRDSTHGIEIKPVKVTDPATSTEITLNGWDFGGQRVYRPTHQLFFSAPAIYLVVWKPREGSLAGAVKEWIKLVKHREPEAKILVVATHGGPKERQTDIDRQEIWDLFGKDTVVDFFHVDSHPPKLSKKTGKRTGNGTGIGELRDSIAKLAASLPEVGRKVPKNWQEAREALRRSKEAYLPLDRVFGICKEHKLEMEDARLLLRICRRVGDLIHYEHDPILSDIVVLKPDWLATAMSFVLEDPQTRDVGHGLVSFTRLGQLWHDAARPKENRYPATLHLIFLRLMERFDLSYRVATTANADGECTSLIAQLVPDVRPDPVRGWSADTVSGDEEQVQICRIVDTANNQSASTEGLFYQLIVRLHKYSLGRAEHGKSSHWQRGLVLEDDTGARAFLEHIGNDVRITVRSPYPERFLAALTYDVQWLVESFWKGVRCEVTVPCLTHVAYGQKCNGLFIVRDLIEDIRDRRPEQKCQVCKKWLPIARLLHNAPSARPDPMGALLANFAAMMQMLEAMRRQLATQQAQIIGRFDQVDAAGKEVVSMVEAAYTGLLHTLTDEAKEGPRLFSFEPVARSSFNPNGWMKKKFRLTLWCEHTRLPLPLINKHDREGVYELELTREWFAQAAPFLKALAVTLSLVMPVAASITKLALDEADYKAIEKQLELGKASTEAMLKGGEKVLDWSEEDEAPGKGREFERGGMIRAQGGVLRQMQAWLKDKDVTYGGLVRVQNKRQEFLWVHPQFEKEY